MRWLIWGFAGGTYHIVRNLMLRLIYQASHTEESDLYMRVIIVIQPDQNSDSPDNRNFHPTPLLLKQIIILMTAFMINIII